MCYDPVGDRILLYGGYVTGIGAADETWELVGDEWNQLSPAHTPGGKYAYSMCWDDANSRLLLYGGGALGLTPDTWEFSGGDWTQLFPADSPDDLAYGNCSNTIQTYDSINGYPALVQGAITGAGLPFAGEATMIFTGGNWVRLTLSNELFDGASFPDAYPRYGISLCCTSEGLQVDGGGNPQPADWNDTWKLPGGTGPNWLETLAYAYPPPAGRWELRVSHRTIWTGDQVFLFSGTWESTAGSPGPNIRLNDSWLYDLAAWNEPSLGGTPPPGRAFFGMAWDPVTPRVVVFGGSPTPTTGPFLGDTWVLEPAAPPPVASIATIKTLFGLGR